ncbi:16S rRNA (guanine(966)-N(2))-methyltransferase RsmD [Halomonas sediminis]
MRPKRSPSKNSSRPSRDPRASAPDKSGKLRIIGGKFRRRQLPVLESPGLRPTPDRVRETLFNWLAAHVEGAQVLDLFAGTGALGIEALSRGAASACLVERDSKVAAQLSHNLALLEVENASVISRDVSAFLTTPPSTAFSLVFLDPPFHQALVEPCCQALENGWLTPQAMIYVETEASLSPPVPNCWSLHRETRAGESIGRLYQRLL